MGKKKKKSGGALKYFALVLLILFLTGALFGYHYYQYIYGKNVTLNSNSTTFYIPTNADYNWVVAQLKSEKIITNQESFDWVAQQKNYPSKVKPGKYVIENDWSNNSLVNLLRSGKQEPVQVKFNNISRLSQLAQIVSQQIEADSAQLMDAFTNADLLKKQRLNKQTVQSIFIPNTYEMYWNTSGEQFVVRMKNEYDHFWNTENLAKAKKLKLTPVEVSTLASIVEAETKKRDEMPKVAGLYLNRLRIGMKLQSDPTVIFAKNKPGVHRVYLKDLEIDSPYNTYKYKGLPPGPISFPSTLALKAVLNHYPSNYVYMCAQPNYTGYHNFASNYNTHLQNRRKYINFLKREGIR